MIRPLWCVTLPLPPQCQPSLGPPGLSRGFRAPWEQTLANAASLPTLLLLFLRTMQDECPSVLKDWDQGLGRWIDATDDIDTPLFPGFPPRLGSQICLNSNY